MLDKMLDDMCPKISGKVAVAVAVTTLDLGARKAQCYIPCATHHSPLHGIFIMFPRTTSIPEPINVPLAFLMYLNADYVAAEISALLEAIYSGETNEVCRALRTMGETKAYVMLESCCMGGRWRGGYSFARLGGQDEDGSILLAVLRGVMKEFSAVQVRR